MSRLFRRRQRPEHALTAYSHAAYELTCPMCDRVERHTSMADHIGAHLQAALPSPSDEEELRSTYPGPQAPPYLIEEPPP